MYNQLAKAPWSLGIPVFGIVDTNTNPKSVDFPIPANDDSIKTIKLILHSLSESINLNNSDKKEEKVENKEKASLNEERK